MIFDDGLADELTALYFTLIDDNFVMFSELNFIILDGFIVEIIFIASLFDVMDYLEQIYGNRKYLSTGL